MKLLILFKSNSQTPTDRIAAWVERELRGETVAIDVAQISDQGALDHYVNWCDKAIFVGPFAPDMIAMFTDKPVLRLFADGVGPNTTLFFNDPEDARDRETKRKLIQRLQLFQRYK